MGGGELGIGLQRTPEGRLSFGGLAFAHQEDAQSHLDRGGIVCRRRQLLQALPGLRDFPRLGGDFGQQDRSFGVGGFLFQHGKGRIARLRLIAGGEEERGLFDLHLRVGRLQFGGLGQKRHRPRLATLLEIDDPQPRHRLRFQRHGLEHVLVFELRLLVVARGKVGVGLLQGPGLAGFLRAAGAQQGKEQEREQEEK